MTDNITDRKELRRRIADREAEFSKTLSGLDAAISAAAAALRTASEGERVARRAHVAGQKARRDYIRNRSEADTADIAQLRATAVPVVVDALSAARLEAARARDADNPARLFAWEACADELSSLLLVDGDMAERIEAILSHVPQRLLWRESFGSLLQARPLVSRDDDNLSDAGRAVETALAQLHRIDPTAKDAAKRINEAMRGVRRYLQPVAARAS